MRLERMRTLALAHTISVLSLSAFLANAYSANANSLEVQNIGKLKKLYERPTSIPYLPENPYSKEKEELGRLLFFDPRLSSSNVMSCATCHNPSFAWGDGLPKAVGANHKVLERKTPTILNLAWIERMMWDGRKTHFEGQAMGPLESEFEMNLPLSGPTGVVEKFKNIRGYEPYFKKAFPQEADPITTENMSKALGVFQRKIVSGEAPFDRWLKGKEKAISEDAKKGFVLFNTKAQCFQCHSGWSFTDGSFHDVGLKSTDIGRGKFLAKLQSQQFAFKTPGLRNISQRDPYMHDGSEGSLKSVVQFYNRGGDVDRPSKSKLIKALGLSDEEVNQVVEFLLTLTSKDEPQVLPELPR